MKWDLQYEARTVCMQRDLYAWNEAYKRDPYAWNETYNMKRELYACKETCTHEEWHKSVKGDLRGVCMRIACVATSWYLYTYKKRPINMKRDLYEGPINMKKALWIGRGTNIYWKETYVYDKRRSYMKRELRGERMRHVLCGDELIVVYI